MKELRIIKIGELEIKVDEINNSDYLCITDFVPKDGNVSSGITIINWLSKIGTINFLGLWEQLNNTNFNVMELHNIKDKTKDGERFSISTKQWIEKTNAIGITSRAGRYNSGTYAHIDIAMEFASWLSPEFKLYLITEFQRLKKEEAIRNKELAEWDNYRWLSKINYRIHTDSIKENIIDKFNIPKFQQGSYCSKEANMLNKIVFGVTAEEYELEHPGRKLREDATTEELAILSNLEASNANMINDKITQNERFKKLSEEKERHFRSFSKMKIPARRNTPLFDKSQQQKSEENNIIEEIIKDNENLKTEDNKDFEKSLNKVIKFKKS